jgi:hypothetical protein
MPSPTFTVEYKSGDFFYNTVATEQNSHLLATFPFTKEKVMKWANEVAKPNPPITSINNIFDPKISKIILNPDYDFKNTFLPGNIVFNNNFNKLTFDLMNPEKNKSLTEKNIPITGKIMLIPSKSDVPPTILDVTPDASSKIHFTQDNMNSWQSDFDLNANMSHNIPFTDIDGGKSNIIMTTSNPRCKYRQTCTMKHWHYSGPCKTQIITQADGSTTCNCVCTGVPVFDSKPHSHCDSYNINSDGTATTPLGIEGAPAGLGLVSAVKSIKMNLNAQFPQPAFGNPGGKVELPYKDHTSLVAGDANIRKLIYDYYYEVNENIRLQSTIQNRGSKDVTSKQALLDATVQYKKEYLNVFNTAIGIVGAAGYIYLMGKEALAVPPK